jgi:hypothetical protein
VRGIWRPQDWALEWWDTKCPTDAPNGHYESALAAAEQPRDPEDAGGCTERLDLDKGALTYAVPIPGAHCSLPMPSRLLIGAASNCCRQWRWPGRCQRW